MPISPQLAVADVADESSLPIQPTYPITNLDNLMAVMSRGTYSNGQKSKVVFFNGENNQIVGEIPTWKASGLPSKQSALGLCENRWW